MHAARGPLRVVAWVVAAGLLVVVLLRLSGLEARSGLVFGLVALSPLVLLAAWPLAAAAGALRDRALVVVAVALVLLQLVWAWPDAPWSAQRAEAGSGGEVVRVVASNVSDVNPTPEALAAALLDEDPDLLVLVEHTPQMAAALEDAGVGEQLPHVVADPRHDTRGSAIYSRAPLEDPGREGVAGAEMLAATVELDGTPTRVVAVHTTQPLVDEEALDRQLGALAAGFEQPGARILAGDFNANAQTAGFRSILEAGGHDAARESGRGWARSWPTRLAPLPVLLLDHVVYSEPLGVLQTAEGGGHGSDHRYVVADLVAPQGPDE